MKAVLHLKFIVLYIIFGFLCVFTTATLTTELITERLEKDTSQTLYREATMIADNYLPSYFSKRIFQLGCSFSVVCYEDVS